MFIIKDIHLRFVLIVPYPGI